jgi:hypothetical protein
MLAGKELGAWTVDCWGIRIFTILGLSVAGTNADGLKRDADKIRKAGRPYR